MDLPILICRYLVVFRIDIFLFNIIETPKQKIVKNIPTMLINMILTIMSKWVVEPSFWFSRMLNQPESLSDKIPLSSSLKGKELALNWGRQNINHTQRVLLSIHHQIPIETLKCERLVFLLYIICQFGKSKGYFYMLGVKKSTFFLHLEEYQFWQESLRRDL